MNYVDLDMSKTETMPRTIETRNLQVGETVLSAVATHTPPSGDALVITPTVDTPYVHVLLGPFDIPGTHFVKVQSIGSNGSKPEIMYQIQVRDA